MTLITTAHPITAETKIAPAGHPFFKEGTKVKVCAFCGLIVIPKLAKHAHGFTHTEMTL